MYTDRIKALKNYISECENCHPDCLDLQEYLQEQKKHTLDKLNALVAKKSQNHEGASCRNR